MKDKYNDLIKYILSDANIYTAYCYVKNNTQNSELRFSQEFDYFELNLESNIRDIKERLEKRLNQESESLRLKKFDYFLKIKKINISDDRKEQLIEYRPLVKYSLDDEVLIQSVINMLAKELKNFLPRENFGVQLTHDDPDYFYKNWQYQYKKFTNYQKSRINESSNYHWVFEYDIKQYYPSIYQKKLIEEIISLLGIPKEKPLSNLIEEIINHYCEDNISIKTQDIYSMIPENRIKKNYGLPQGPLFSAFLSSIFSHKVFNNLRNKIRDKFNVEIDCVAYVDDGRIFFKDDIEVKGSKKDNTEKNEIDKDNDEIKNKCDTLIKVVEEVYTELNKVDERDIVNEIVLNTDKTSLIGIYEKSVGNILSYLTHKISAINASIDPNMETDDSLIGTLETAHDNFKNALELLNKDAQEYEKFKIKKEKSTYLKRAASFKTRKIVDSHNFRNIVEEVLPLNLADDILYDLSQINFYYIVSNLFKGSENPEDTAFLVRHLIKVRKNYINALKNDRSDSRYHHDIFAYYDMQLLKIIYELEYNSSVYELYKELCVGVDAESFIYPYLFGYCKSSWFSGLDNKNNGDYCIENDKENFAIKALSHFHKKPLILYPSLESELFISPVFWKTNLDKYKNVFIRNNINISIAKISDIYHFDDEKKENKDWIRLNSSVFSDSKRMNLLFALFEFWIYIFEKEKSIEEFYFHFDNYIVYQGQMTEVVLLKNTSKLYDNIQYKKHRYPLKEVLFEFFSELFNIGDNLLVTKKMKPVLFWQYRILSYLQNVSGRMNLNDFLGILKDIKNNIEMFCYPVDSNYELIRKIVDAELFESYDKDIILQLHYFVSCVWKNGSKDLPFFTLHNQDHSLELIKNYSLMSQKMMDNLTLNSDEKFLLFASCYLHDLGMLKGATEEERNDLNNKAVYRYYEKAKIILDKKEDSSFKYSHILSKCMKIFQNTEELYEIIVRGTHSKRSKDFLEKDKKLPLNEIEKRIIGEVSFNHCAEDVTVYGIERKEYFRNHQIDIRLISIWLRLLDLTDITKSRVTQHVFSQYYIRMGVVSRYHWIHHLSIDEIEFSVEPINEENKKGITLGEYVFYITIVLNYIPPSEKINLPCKYGNCLIKSKEGYWCIEKENNKNKRCTYCDIQCAFLNEGYFIPEIIQLNQLLSEYQQQISFELRYRLNDNPKEDFYIQTENGNISASEAIKEYFNQ